MCAHLDVKTDTKLVWVQEHLSFALIVTPYCGACGRRFVVKGRRAWFADGDREVGLFVEAEK